MEFLIENLETFWNIEISKTIWILFSYLLPTVYKNNFRLFVLKLNLHLKYDLQCANLYTIPSLYA